MKSCSFILEQNDHVKVLFKKHQIAACSVTIIAKIINRYKSQTLDLRLNADNKVEDTNIGITIAEMIFSIR